MIDKTYKGIGRTIDTNIYELLPKLRHLTLEGQDDDGNLIWSGHQQAFGEAEYEESYYCEHGQFPVERDDYDASLI